ncbi:flagellar hook capping FlgD N-terminal domain-containing protein [Anaeromicropila populeti]|uniref:Basal-body rod modification protein FlgD n=1 Tax=Anaeromicropila populeti TaxID=37658 RepID=A0A1I6KX91_9FIRM|nr:flagellar hook capping FlgD N-terminal domain-containing protein [Anaeromicropila populeti]SFR95849.1 flagellar basal-body rod modification protein FlgD [Anaeromicropila populeti]
MSNLTAAVTDGVVQQTTSSTSTKSTRGTSELGKDAFLQLLVTQMQYQDPLNPQADTEFISQLATFSSLEQMQNLNKTFTSAQAFSLIGQTVVVSKSTDSTDSTDSKNSSATVQGKVDYVTVSGGTTYLSIDGTLYSTDKLQTVIDSNYIAQQQAPTVTETKLAYDHDDAKDVEVQISLGEEEGEASSFAVLVNGSLIDPAKMSFDTETEKLTIKKEAFSGLDAGTYKIVFLFDDQLETTISDKVSVTITGTKPVSDNGDTETA